MLFPKSILLAFKENSQNMCLPLHEIKKKNIGESRTNLLRNNLSYFILLSITHFSECSTFNEMTFT